jgi:hypothetical protein
MARTKQRTPLKREASDFMEEVHDGNGQLKTKRVDRDDVKSALAPVSGDQAGLAELVICVGGIYASLYEPFRPVYASR